MIKATPVYDQRDNLVCVHMGSFGSVLTGDCLGWQELDGKDMFVTRVQHKDDGRSKVWVDTDRALEGVDGLHALFNNALAVNPPESCPCCGQPRRNGLANAQGSLSYQLTGKSSLF